MKKIEEVVFYSLEKAIKIYRQFAQEKIKEAGFDITIDQWLLLKTLQENPSIQQQEIAEKVFKDIASITRIIDLLVKKGYVTRTSHKTDGRRFSLTITMKGNLIISSVSPIVQSYRKQALKRVTPIHIGLMKSILETIINNCK